MTRVQFYKELFDRELNRRNDLDYAINLPVTALTVMGGAIGYFAQDLELCFSAICAYWNNLFLVLSCVSYLIALVFLFWSYNNFFFGYGYTNIAYLSRIRDYEKKLHIKNLNHAKAGNGKHLRFSDALIDKMVSIADHNAVLNTKRSLMLYRSKTFIVITLILLTIHFLFTSFM